MTTYAPRAGLDGPSVPIIVEPLKLPAPAHEPARETPAEPHPVPVEPEKIPA